MPTVKRPGTEADEAKEEVVVQSSEPNEMCRLQSFIHTYVSEENFNLRTGDATLLGYPDNLDNSAPVGKIVQAIMSCNQGNAAIFNLGSALLDRKTRANLPNSLDAECKLLKDLMKHWQGDDVSSWGYLTQGGTEGVSKGLLEGLRHLNYVGYKSHEIMIVHCKSSHYSINKAYRFYSGKLKRIVVDSNQTFSMNLQDLSEKLSASTKTGNENAILIMCTLGSTFGGGCDDLHQIKTILYRMGFKLGKNAYMHVDAALHGGFAHLTDEIPSYVIGKDFSSVSVSQHKWSGCWVGGVVLIATQGNEIETQTSGDGIKYLNGMKDDYVSGTRSGIAAVVWLWRNQFYDDKKVYSDCKSKAIFLANELQKNGVHVKAQYLNVVMPKPADWVCHKWQLMLVEQEAQVICLPHVKEHHLRAFVSDYVETEVTDKSARRESYVATQPSRRTSFTYSVIEALVCE